ncbi:hypothetical protein K0B03_01240 [Patescibacteria group bacterium]|nr:hypothetical protein [Patescibacteria group bacterium]
MVYSLVYLYNSETEVKGLVEGEEVSLNFYKNGPLFLEAFNGDFPFAWDLEGETKIVVENLGLQSPVDYMINNNLLSRMCWTNTCY